MPSKFKLLYKIGMVTNLSLRLSRSDQSFIDVLGQLCGKQKIKKNICFIIISLNINKHKITNTIMFHLTHLHFYYMVIYIHLIQFNIKIRWLIFNSWLNFGPFLNSGSLSKSSLIFIFGAQI